MKNGSKYNRDFVEKVKEYYLSNEFSLEEISENSESLFSKYIPLADLKAMSRNDIIQWSVLKANKGRKTDDVPMAEKILAVANKLYEQMFKDGDDELSPTQLAQTAKTWSDLVDKTKLTKDTTSAKLPTQQVKDMIDKALAENKR